MRLRLLPVLMAAVLLAWLAPQAAHGQLRIRDLCRVKGQEENTLHGLGLVVGLEGTGDGDLKPTTRALAQMLALMGNPVSEQDPGVPSLEELKDVKNVALVFVTATVPAGGAREGTELTCRVQAVSAKSLRGGVLMLAPLLGPAPGDGVIYGFAQGPITLEDEALQRTGLIAGGCRLERDIRGSFVHDNRITLVLDRRHAGFQTANDIAELIKTAPNFRYGEDGVEEDVALALDASNIEVRIPPRFQADPVLFVSQVLDQRVYRVSSEKRVVIQERTGVVVIGADVEIGPVAVTHKGIAVETGPFVPLDATAEAAPPQGTRLKALVDALNAVKASPQDIIEIIKGIERNGLLYGELIVE